MITLLRNTALFNDGRRTSRVETDIGWFAGLTLLASSVMIVINVRVHDNNSTEIDIMQLARGGYIMHLKSWISTQKSWSKRKTKIPREQLLNVHLFWRPQSISGEGGEILKRHRRMWFLLPEAREVEN